MDEEPNIDKEMTIIFSIAIITVHDSGGLFHA